MRAERADLSEELLEHERLSGLNIEEPTSFGVLRKVNCMVANRYSTPRLRFTGCRNYAVGKVLQGEGEFVKYRSSHGCSSMSTG